MKITLYVPGLPFDGDTIREGKSLGGSETMGYYVAEGLAARGHNVQCFCTTDRIKSINNVSYIPMGEVNQQNPYGVEFQKYAVNIPSDVVIAQRAAGIFNAPFHSKLNYFWTHDLALKRYHPHINAMMWNVNKVLGVSQFHVDQIRKIYGINEKYIDFIPNGVDLDMCQPGTLETKIQSKILFYSSRPERGLANLVGENGIMENLYKIDPEITLVVTGYDNTTPQSAPLYNQLYQRCQMLPNVRNYGYLSKQELSALMQKAWLHVYPTEFEEVSCITAMEEQAAGTPFLATQTAALPETLRDAGVFWSTIPEFVNAIIHLQKNPSKYQALYEKAIKKRPQYSLEHTVDKLEKIIEHDFERLGQNKQRLFDSLVYHSDIQSAIILNQQENLGQDKFLSETFQTAQTTCNDTQDFYKEMAEYHLAVDDKHGLGQYDQTLNIPRIKPLVQELARLQPGSLILDYGCCVGHVTTALAKVFPDLIFEGCDIDAAQIKTGEEFIKKEGFQNISLFQCVTPANLSQGKYDAVICGEVLEHIWDYKTFLIELELAVKEGGKLYLSTPYGPWEALSFDKAPYKRQHLHQFEYADIEDIIGHKQDKNILYINHPDKNRDKFGFYFWSWTRTKDNQINSIDYARKLKIQNPHESVSACFITKANCGTIQRSMESIAPFVSEFIIAVDEKTLNGGKLEECLTYRAVRDFDNVNIFVSKSPLEIGFDEARNITVGKATKDWILWLDDDEIWTWADRIKLYLRDNQFNAYAINQYHFSAEPAGITKTDLPCRLFRNYKGISFYGVVHEHPELGLNKGTEQTQILNQNMASIMHIGYESEEVRRKRFQRNWPLMQRDIQKYPDRFLGRALFLRDLDHLNRFEWERTGQVTGVILKRCEEILKRWRKLIELKQTRFVLDSLVYITNTVNFMTNGQGGYDFKFGIVVDRLNMIANKEPQIITGKVLDKADLQTLINLLVDENMMVFENNAQYL